MQSSFLSYYGEQVIDNGYPIIPIAPGKKFPVIEGWQKLETTHDDLAAWKANGRAKDGIGVLAKFFPGIDIDVLDPIIVDKLLSICYDVLGTDDVMERTGKFPKVLLPCRTDSPFTKVMTPIFIDTKGNECRVEILGDGQQYVCYHIHPETGDEYMWGPKHPANTPSADLPSLTHKMAIEICRRAAELFESLGWARKGEGSIGTSSNNVDPLEAATPPTDLTDDQVVYLVNMEDSDDRHTWVDVGLMLFHQYRGEEKGFEIWDVWSQSSETKYDEGDTRRVWESFKTDTSRKPLTMRSLIQKYGQPPLPPADTPQTIPNTITDQRLAHMFCEDYRGRCLYLQEKKGWLIYDGARWCMDTKGGVFPLIRKMLDDVMTKAAKIEASDRRAAVIKQLLKYEKHTDQTRLAAAASVTPRMIVRAEELDNNPMLLNCSNGLLNLETGIFLEHTPNYLITKTTHLPYDSTAKCPVFLDFLNEIMLGRQKLVDYLQRWFGYCLTGKTTEQVLAFFYGTGSNGKSTLTEVLQTILGDFSITADRSVLMQRNKSGVGDDLAPLRGSRLVSVSELNDGEVVDEAAVKTITGGDEISCRYLYGDYFTYRPTFKVIMFGNHKPNIRSQDHGIWRRIHLIPFDRTFKPEERDPSIPEHIIKNELPGVLTWAVEGCRLWQREGLNPPHIVIEEVEKYKRDEDIFAAWLEENCVLGDEYESGSKELRDNYGAYTGWRNISTTKFGRLLSDHRFEKRKTGGVVKWKGIGLANMFDGFV